MKSMHMWRGFLALGLLGHCLSIPAAAAGAYGNTITLTDNAVSAQLGQTVAYTIAGEVPDTSGFRTYGYTIQAEMTEGLTWDENPVVYFGEDQIAIRPEITDSGFSVGFDMVKWQDRVGQPITVTYTARINEKSGEPGTAEASTATLTCACDPGDGIQSVTAEPVKEGVCTSALVPELVHAQDHSRKLADAQFVLRNAEEAYYHLEGDCVSWITEADDATFVTTDEMGTARFSGLKNGTYYLQQIKALEGFLLPEKPEAVEIHAQAYADRVVCVVEGHPGRQLPAAGGGGLAVMYIPGAILTGIALILAAEKRRTDG